MRGFRQWLASKHAHRKQGKRRSPPAHPAHPFESIRCQHPSNHAIRSTSQWCARAKRWCPCAKQCEDPDNGWHAQYMTSGARRLRLTPLGAFACFLRAHLSLELTKMRMKHVRHRILDHCIIPWRATVRTPIYILRIP